MDDKTETMTIVLIGYNPDNYWTGSSTLYYQKSLLEHLQRSADHSVFLYYPYRRRKVFQYFFSQVRSSTREGKNIVQGGILPLLLYVRKLNKPILHFVVVRNYMLWILLWTKVFRIQSVMTLHDTLFLRRWGLRKNILLKKLMLKLAGDIFVQNQLDVTCVRQVKSDSHVHLQKIGISVVARSNCSAPQSKKILFAGGLGLPYKGLSFLEDALERVKNQHEIILCGEKRRNKPHSNYYGELKRHEFQNLLRTVRMVVVPSEYESYGMVALEALASGTPVILTDCCGISRYLEHGIDCMKIHYGDVEALSKSIDQLLVDDVLWQALSANGIKTARTFLWENIVEEYFNSYKSLLDVNTSPA